MIKVLPTSPEMMKHLKHPTGVRFHSMDVPVDWPDDQFTTRRLKDGGIKLAEPEPPAAPTEESK